LRSSACGFDVIVIGAGPVGSNVAAMVAKEGYRVALIDRYKEDERPTRCGALVTPRVLDLVDAKMTVMNHIRGAVVCSPGGREVIVDGRETKAVVIDREAFENKLIKRARDEGVECLFGASARAARRSASSKVEVSVHGVDDAGGLFCRILIGADGTAGGVPGWFSTSKPRKVLLGCEQSMSGVDGDERFVKLFLGRDFAPGFFGWIIPGGGIARVGLCAERGNVRMNLKRMMTRPAVKKCVGRAEPVDYSAGRIPIGFPQKTSAQNIMVVGDAACQVKATSGGGVFTGLLCSTICAETAIKALEKEDFSARMMGTYHRGWMKRIGRELRRDLAIHDAFSRLTDRQLDDLIRLLDRPHIIEMVQQFGDIDFPSKVGWRLVREEPGLLKYAGNALRVLFRRGG
jgi:digeranylgeranylglycerophospholipid reductase